MVRKWEFLTVSLYSLISVHVGLHSCHFLYLHLNAVLHTDHWIIILYNCCIPRYYFCRILYGSELCHIDNSSKKWHLSSSWIRSYRILFGFLHNVAEKLEWFCQKIVVCLHRLLHSSENGQQKHCWHSQSIPYRNQWLWLTESTFLTLSAYYLCYSTRQYKAF